MDSLSKTKIVATVGPASASKSMLSRLSDLGVNVFRFNTKHADVEWHRKTIELVRTISQTKKRAHGILIDIQGPEIRIRTEEGEPIPVKRGEELYIATKFLTEKKTIKVAYKSVLAVLKKGNTVLIDDGLQQFTVIKKTADHLVIKAHDDYSIETNKSMNLPGLSVDLPLLSARDKSFIDLAKDVDAEFIALSFVRSKADLKKLQKELDARKMDVHVISKIENQPALDNIDEIIEHTDGIMIGRGDLGVEIPVERVAYWQKQIINKCRKASKPVITATQMLQSMITSPLPTRAEATDVSNAVYDGTDAVMLSAETAGGMYPAESVDMMHRIALYNEQNQALGKTIELDVPLSQVGSLTKAAVGITEQLCDFDVDGIVVYSQTGRTVRSLSRYRPNTPIWSLTPNQKVTNQLSLSYGVESVYFDSKKKQVDISEIIDILKKKKKVKKGNRLLFVHGEKWHVPGETNTLTIKEVS